MSTNRVSPSAGRVDARQLPKGPNGRALCRNCATEVAKGRRTFCSDACADDWAVRNSPSLMRQRVFKRDRGVCALCGVDSALLGKTLTAEWQRLKLAATDQYLTFVTLHQEVTGEEPGPFGANAFDGMNLIALAMVASGSCDGTGINDAIKEVSAGGTPVTSFAEGAELLANGEDIDYQGASGPVDLDDTGSVVNSYSVQQVQEGVWADVKFYSATELADLSG